MEYRWEKDQKKLREERYKHQRENPSFSSTLLDAIYRSIDESNGREGDEEGAILCSETMRKKQNVYGFGGEGGFVRKEEDITSLRRAWMAEKKLVGFEKVATGRRKSTAECNSRPDGRKFYSADRPHVLMNSSSSSSESSSVGGFSSSESESFYGGNSSKSSTTYCMHKPPPIRISVSSCPDKNLRPVHHHHHHEDDRSVPTQKLKHEGKSFGKTKSKALKIYGDLKKAKQPISPSGRLASFLNSIFTNGNSKKPKFSSSSGSSYDHERKMAKPEQESTCSSASSFSRSCLSKTPSSRGKSRNNGDTRSVRFYPLSVIVDEDSRACGHKTLYQENPTAISTTKRSISTTNEELKFHVMSENLRVQKVAMDLLRNYHKKLVDINREEHVASEVVDEDEEDDDGASYASSDLFELDNLSSIGINGHRYSEELPVYETTDIGTNRAIKIANGTTTTKKSYKGENWV